MYLVATKPYKQTQVNKGNERQSCLQVTTRLIWHSSNFLSSGTIFTMLWAIYEKIYGENMIKPLTSHRSVSVCYGITLPRPFFHQTIEIPVNTIYPSNLQSIHPLIIHQPFFHSSIESPIYPSIHASIQYQFIKLSIRSHLFRNTYSLSHLCPISHTQ